MSDTMSQDEIDNILNQLTGTGGGGDDSSSGGNFDFGLGGGSKEVVSSEGKKDL